MPPCAVSALAAAFAGVDDSRRSRPPCSWFPPSRARISLVQLLQCIRDVVYARPSSCER